MRSNRGGGGLLPSSQYNSQLNASEGKIVPSTTPWGTEDSTGSASIDWVLLAATRPLTGREILDEVRRRGLPERKDANPHLSTLKKKGFITNENGKWFRVSLKASDDTARPAPTPTVPLPPPRPSVANVSVRRDAGGNAVEITPDVAHAQVRLVAVIRRLAVEKQAELDRLKANQADLARPDFLWHYLLQSFATMGRSAGWDGLIGNRANYDRVTYPALQSLPDGDRLRVACAVCRAAKVRMPDLKGEYIVGCFDRVRRMGGPETAKAKLLALLGRDAKIQWLKALPGIGDKYARNIMMDVYHEDFRDSIAVDVRIKSVSDRLGLSFASYAPHEAFYLEVAREADLNGWELDRLLYNFLDEVLSRL